LKYFICAVLRVILTQLQRNRLFRLMEHLCSQGVWITEFPLSIVTAQQQECIIIQLCTLDNNYKSYVKGMMPHSKYMPKGKIYPGISENYALIIYV